jgi:hypothetical protein
MPDSAGTLYGTTLNGGQGAHGGCPCRIVFKVDTSGKETVLRNFDGATEGAGPWAAVIRDSDGNFYGTATSGGTFKFGTAFTLDRPGN